MKSTLRRTYFKCIRRDLDSTFALGLGLRPRANVESKSFLGPFPWRGKGKGPGTKVEDTDICFGSVL